MNLPNMNNPVPDKNGPEYTISRYNGARSNLLLAIVFTAVNIVLTAAGSDLYFLFSIMLPYSMFGAGTVLTVLAVALLGVYVLCYFLSKDKRGWLTAALVLFIVDTLAFAGIFVLAVISGGLELGSSLFDVVFHVWVLISLIGGVRYGKKLDDAKAQLEAAQTAQITENAE